MNHYQADQKIPEDDIYDYGLWNLNRILVGMGRSLAEFPPMYHNLAKQLSYYFILLSFDFLFFSYLDLLYKKEV